MELNAEQVKSDLAICALGDCQACHYNKFIAGCRDEMCGDALALINSQEQRIQELEARNRQYGYEQRKLVEAHDTYKEYAEKMQLFVEKIKHREEEGYEPSAARYVAEMEMWRVVALEKQKLTEENEKLKSAEFTCGFIKPHKVLECPIFDEIERTKADTVRDMHTMFAIHFGTYTENDTVKIKDLFSLIDQIANELLNTEKCENSPNIHSEKCEIVKKTIDAIKSRSDRHTYSCMISGNMRETYTISGKALEEIEKEMLEE